MRETLANIKAQAMEQIAQDGADLDALRIKYLGKKGELTAVLRGMGALSAEERPVIGQLANEVRATIEEALTKKAAEQKEKELEARLNQTPFVKESVVVGYFNSKKRDWDIVAILHPDYDKMREVYGGEDAAMLSLEMKKAVSLVNGAVLPFKRICCFVIRKEPFSKNTSQKIMRSGVSEWAKNAYLSQIKK
jgi:hypothetical protein